jgi:hypothetical protein
MIPVPADHVAKIGHSLCLPGGIPDMLPARKFFEDEETELVACIEKMGRLGIMARADDDASELTFEYLRVAPLCVGTHGIPGVGILLVAIEPPQKTRRD